MQNIVSTIKTLILRGKFSKKECETLQKCGYIIDPDRRKAWKQNNSYWPYR